MRATTRASQVVALGVAAGMLTAAGFVVAGPKLFDDDSGKDLQLKVTVVEASDQPPAHPDLAKLKTPPYSVIMGGDVWWNFNGVTVPEHLGAGSVRNPVWHREVRPYHPEQHPPVVLRATINVPAGTQLLCTIVSVELGLLDAKRGLPDAQRGLLDAKLSPPNQCGTVDLDVSSLQPRPAT